MVTGASKGIGAGVAEQLAKEGAAVIVNFSSDAKGAAAVVTRIQAAGGQAKAIQANVSKTTEAKELIEKSVGELGRLDILVNNAGVYEFLPLDKVTETHFDRIFDLNVKGLLFITQAAVNAFGDRGGNIVNVSSLASVSALANGSVYSASKAALDAFTRSLAAELGPKKIRINSVLPGPVETEGATSLPEWDFFLSQVVPRTPLGRIGKPQDVARAVSFLASEDAGWITGQILETAGGLRV